MYITILNIVRNRVVFRLANAQRWGYCDFATQVTEALLYSAKEEERLI